jgi:hypothetical protein
VGLYFRKRGSLFGNLLRFSLTGAGLGVSLGVRGFRAGISSSGRRYVSASLPGAGLYMRHCAHAQPHSAIAPRNPIAIPHPVGPELQAHPVSYAVGYIVGWVLILSPFVAIAWWLFHAVRR